MASSACNEVRCGNDFECTGERVCTPYESVGDQCFGYEPCGPTGICYYDVEAELTTCSPRAALGASCRSERCEVGLACSSDQICIAYPGAGEACAYADGEVCAEGLVCLRNRICGPPPQADEPCGIRSACAEGLGCERRDTGPTCAPQRESGPCERDNICAEGFYCDDELRSCEPRLTLGSACVNHRQCPAVAYCGMNDRGEEVCLPMPSLGERCGGECLGQAYCKLTNGACQPKICQRF